MKRITTQVVIIGGGATGAGIMRDCALRGIDCILLERDDIAAYINTLKAGEGLSETAIREGYLRFKKERDSAELAAIATRHGLAAPALQAFVDHTLQRLILDGERLSDLMAPLDLGWKARAQAETALMADLMPLLNKRAQGREISGLSAYEQ